MTFERILGFSTSAAGTTDHYDFAWPSLRIGCECDGFEHHGSRLAWKRDRSRLAAIEAAGWRIVHVTWADVTLAADQTRDRLALALREAA